MSKERIRVNFYVSASDGFLYEELLKADTADRSDTIRRLAQEGAMLERMIASGFQGDVLKIAVSAQTGGKAPSLQSNKGGRSSGKKVKPEIEDDHPKDKGGDESKIEPGFGDVPIGVDF